MDLRGIEPLSPGCKPGALPLSYRPTSVYHVFDTDRVLFCLLGKTPGIADICRQFRKIIANDFRAPSARPGAFFDGFACLRHMLTLKCPDKMKQFILLASSANPGNCRQFRKIIADDFPPGRNRTYISGLKVRCCFVFHKTQGLRVFLEILFRPAGVEPATISLKGSCSAN